jgi:hypothetical protein
MDKNVLELVAMCVLALCEVYAVHGSDISPLAYVYDFIATITGYIANWLGFVSMRARLNYMEVIQA